MMEAHNALFDFRNHAKSRQGLLNRTNPFQYHPLHRCHHAAELRHSFERFHRFKQVLVEIERVGQDVDQHALRKEFGLQARQDGARWKVTCGRLHGLDALCCQSHQDFAVELLDRVGGARQDLFQLNQSGWARAKVRPQHIHCSLSARQLLLDRQLVPPRSFGAHLRLGPAIRVQNAVKSVCFWVSSISSSFQIVVVLHFPSVLSPYSNRLPSICCQVGPCSRQIHDLSCSLHTLKRPIFCFECWQHRPHPLVSVIQRVGPLCGQLTRRVQKPPLGAVD
mmetsp:Transcript_21678/g.43021  ORF Transcript_21678/g.43021 Transcript_21678/m.43021 type:complete len:279 (+) Transcript_21678:128-964(+)